MSPQPSDLPDKSLVHKILLQRHRSALFLLTCSQLVSRVLLCACAILSTLAVSNIYEIYPLAMISAILTFTWGTTTRSASHQAYSIEQSYARQYGGDVEDFYISSRYFLDEYKHHYYPLRNILLHERYIWLILIYVILVAQSMLVLFRPPALR